MNISSDRKRQNDREERFETHAVYVYIPTSIILTTALLICLALGLRDVRLENERKARTEMNAPALQQDQPSETKKQ